MLKAAANPSQTKITDYCELVKKVEVLLSVNSECSNIIAAASKTYRERQAISHPDEVEVNCSLLKRLLDNIKKNSDKIPQAKWHDHII